MFPIIAILLSLLSPLAEVSAALHIPDFLPCDPESEILGMASEPGEPSSQFCAQWNPDFTFNGNKCCGKMPIRVGRRKRRSPNRCSPTRTKSGYCSEMTEDQKNYISSVISGKIPDVLHLIKQDLGKMNREQAYCTVNNGFLVNGRPVVSTEANRIIVKSPERCLNFGTDAMVGMVEWLGREVVQFNSKARLVLGDISGPRGGCLFGRSGKRGHASHTTGQDADIGFLAKPSDAAESRFIHHFDPAKNWWFLKKIFRNPFACIKVIFLDRRHIRTLSKFAKKDREWSELHRFIRHMPGHKNHLHVRIGKGPGQPGCSPDAKPELETEEDLDLDGDIFDEELIDELRSRQGLSVQR